MTPKMLKILLRKCKYNGEGLWYAELTNTEVTNLQSLGARYEITSRAVDAKQRALIGAETSDVGRLNYMWFTCSKELQKTLGDLNG